MSAIDVICDNANRDLDQLPAITMQMSNLKMLYLENNRLTNLPEDFFYKLPLLNWLDLRNNQLTAIPASIEFHSFLENLLLQNNKITKLPNELGVVPNLKVLQISGNPLKYPCKDITENGIDDICAFLKLKYDKERSNKNQCIYIKEPVVIKPKITPTSSTSTQNKLRFEEIRRTVRKRIAKTHSPQQSILTVTSLTKIHQEQQQPSSLEQIDNLPEDNCCKDSSSAESKLFKIENDYPPDRKVHKIVSEGSKLSVKSRYNNNYQTYKYTISSKRNKDSITEFSEDRLYEKRVQGQQLKDLWLAKLKDLLHDQEKIIQQERNLIALNKWRQEKRHEPIREFDSESGGRKLVEPPYDIDPEYCKFPSRSDLAKQLDKFVRCSSDGTKTPHHVDIQRLINNLIKQLREIETSTQESNKSDATPQKKLISAEKDMGMIMDLQKKITELQNQNKVWN